MSKVPWPVSTPCWIAAAAAPALAGMIPIGLRPPIPCEEGTTYKVLMTFTFESHGQNLALTVLHVPYSLDSGPRRSITRQAKTPESLNPKHLQVVAQDLSVDHHREVLHQPSERDRIAFFRSLICTGAPCNPEACGTNQGD